MNPSANAEKAQVAAAFPRAERCGKLPAWLTRMAPRFQFSLGRMFGNITLLCLALMLLQLGLANSEVRGLAYVFAVFAVCIWIGDLFGKPGLGAMAPLIAFGCFLFIVFLIYFVAVALG